MDISLTSLPLVWLQAIAITVLVGGYLAWLSIRRRRGMPWPSSGQIYPSVLLLGLGGFIIKQLINSTFYILYAVPYPNEGMESVRELVLIGALGLSLHLCMIINHARTRGV